MSDNETRTPEETEGGEMRRVITGKKARELADSVSVAFDPKAFDRVLAAVSGTASDGDLHRSLRRRTIDITIEPGLCRPGTFTKPFKLTMIELDSDQELRALTRLGQFVSLPDENDEEKEDDESDESDELPDSEEVGGNVQALAMVLAREAIFSVNGRKLARHEKPILWEMLGMGGRTAAGTAFIAHGTGMDGELVKKSIASVAVI
jgi:hypothetical protein